MDAILEAEAKCPETQERFVLIGACHPRTGTVSLKAALMLLLGGKVAHMHDLLFSNRVDKWRYIYSGTATDEEFRNFFLQRGYLAAVDAPFCFHVEQALRAFPDSKVLLTYRDTDKWYDSIRETVYKALRDEIHNVFPCSLLNKLGIAPIEEYTLQLESPIQVFATAFESRQSSKEYFDAYRQRIRSLVPADRLLEFNVKEGWGPLCQFLGVPVPTISFPHLNTAPMFKQVFIDSMRAQAWKRFAWLLLLVFIVLFFFMWLVCTLFK